MPRVRAVLGGMSHRGPDGSDLSRFGHTILGHGRLAVRDPSPRARQPLAREDGRYVLAFNGEIHNHREIRAELEAEGATFRSTGDTEVLLEFLARRGADGLRALNGEFALAFFDRESGELLLARDPYGVKPLAYVAASDGFWFASEPSSLLAPAGPALREANEAAVAAFLLEGHLESGDRTFFRDVAMVRPCHLLVVREGEVVANRPYRAFPHETPAARDLGVALADAVERRLDSDVPVGASLSSGLDSAGVAAHAALARPGLPTFTVAMPDPALDESEGALETATRIGADPTFVVLAPPTPAAVEALIREQGGPVSSLSVYAKRANSAAARASGVVVLLDGQGADELLAGYPHLRAYYLHGLLRRGRLVRFAREARSLGVGHLALALYLLLPRPIRTGLRRFALRRSGRHLHRSLLRRHPPGPALDLRGPSPLKAALAAALTGPALGGLLRYADRSTMAESVEERYPYLDPGVVSAAFALSDDELAGDGRTKAALRRALRGLVPTAVLENRSKMDFRTPDRAWLEGPLEAHFRDALLAGALEDRKWLAPGSGEKLYRAWRRGRDGGVAFRAYALSVFVRIHLSDPATLRSAKLEREVA